MAFLGLGKFRTAVERVASFFGTCMALVLPVSCGGRVPEDPGCRTWMCCANRVYYGPAPCETDEQCVNRARRREMLADAWVDSLAYDSESYSDVETKRKDTGSGHDEAAAPDASTRGDVSAEERVFGADADGDDGGADGDDGGTDEGASTAGDASAQEEAGKPAENWFCDKDYLIDEECDHKWPTCRPRE